LLVVAVAVVVMVVVAAEEEQVALLLVLPQYHRDLLIRLLLEVVDLLQQHLVYRHMLADRDKVCPETQVVHLVAVAMQTHQMMITLKVDMVVHKEILVVPEITDIIIHIEAEAAEAAEQEEQEILILTPVLKVAAAVGLLVDLE
jgi:hypothetical protein